MTLIIVMIALIATGVWLMFNIKVGVMASAIVLVALAAFAAFGYVTLNEENNMRKAQCDRLGGMFIHQGAETLCVDRDSVQPLDRPSIKFETPERGFN